MAETEKPKYPYEWYLKDYPFEKNKGKVFSCFAGGGGSTMGYKLAGFDVIGFNEIDPRVSAVYQKNHKPEMSFVCPIRDMLTQDLPEELYNLDILDGSPPCTSFSEAGLREKTWGKEKKFAEGQVCQVLDTLFFDFIDLAGKLKPKIIIAENVRGLIQGKAQKYTSKIMDRFREIGYMVKWYLLNSRTAGIPQARNRVFFVCVRNDIPVGVRSTGFLYPDINVNLVLNMRAVPFSEISDHTDTESNLTDLYRNYWNNARYGQPVGKFETLKKQHPDKPVLTIVTGDCHFHPDYPRHMNTREVSLASSFPLDYDFMNYNPKRLMGMSVPPVWVAHILERIKNQVGYKEGGLS